MTPSDVDTILAILAAALHAEGSAHIEAARAALYELTEDDESPVERSRREHGPECYCRSCLGHP